MITGTKLFELEVFCPECGGTVIWMEQQIIGRCEFCSSSLLFEPDIEHRFYVEPRVKSSDDVKKVLVLWKAQQKRSETLGRLHSHNDTGPVDVLNLIDLDLAPFVSEFDDRLTLRNASLLYVPYWQFQASLIQCLLGVDPHGTKEYMCRRAAVDQAVAAYDQEQWNFRDRGLRFKDTRFKEVTRGMLSSQAHLPFSAETEAMCRRIVQAQPPLEEDRNFLFKYYSLCDERRIPVLRPYWIVNYVCGESETVLVDACFGNVAGHPDEAEARKLFAYHGKPLAPADTPALRVITSRCPDCGADTEWSIAERVHFCANCGRALVLDSGEISIQPYTYVEPPNDEHILLPFWKFQIKLEFRNKTYRELAEYFRMFFQDRLLKQHVSGDCVCVPAFFIQRNRRGDQLLGELLCSAVGKLAILTTGPIQPQTEIRPGQIDGGTAAQMLGALIPSVAGAPTALYKMGSLNQMLKDTVLNCEKPELIVLPYPVEADHLIVNSKSFGLGLLDRE